LPAVGVGGFAANPVDQSNVWRRPEEPTSAHSSQFRIRPDSQLGMLRRANDCWAALFETHFLIGFLASSDHTTPPLR
jgi:hypothetical protein